LNVSREQTNAACADLGLKPWQDPHNEDLRYARARLRAAMPLLIETLGSDVVANLARTAGLIAADNDVLDEMAIQEFAQASEPDGGLSVALLRQMPDALRGRVLRLFALGAGATPAALSHRHLSALDAFVTQWHGQGPVALPGGTRVARRAERLVVLDDNW
jgi:tRNA(Ile)-lysidine synthase